MRSIKVSPVAEQGTTEPQTYHSKTLLHNHAEVSTPIEVKKFSKILPRRPQHLTTRYSRAVHISRAISDYLRNVSRQRAKTCRTTRLCFKASRVIQGATGDKI